VRTAQLRGGGGAGGSFRACWCAFSSIAESIVIVGVFAVCYGAVLVDAFAVGPSYPAPGPGCYPSPRLRLSKTEAIALPRMPVSTRSTRSTIASPSGSVMPVAH